MSNTAIIGKIETMNIEKGARKKKLAFLAGNSAKGGGYDPQQLRNASFFGLKKRDVLK